MKVLFLVLYPYQNILSIYLNSPQDSGQLSPFRLNGTLLCYFSEIIVVFLWHLPELSPKDFGNKDTVATWDGCGSTRKNRKRKSKQNHTGSLNGMKQQTESSQLNNLEPVDTALPVLTADTSNQVYCYFW